MLTQAIHGLSHTFLVGIVQLAVFVLIVVLSVLNRRGFGRHWRRGLVIGLVVFAMLVPVMAYNIAYFDPSRLAPRTLPGVSDQGTKTAVYVVLGVAIALRVVGIFWNMVIYCVAAVEWKRSRLVPFPLIGAGGSMPPRRDADETGGLAESGAKERSRVKADVCGPPNAFDEQTEADGPGPYSPEDLPADARNDMVVSQGRYEHLESGDPAAPENESSRATEPFRKGGVAAAVFGAVAGIVSALVFDALDVRESEYLRNMLDRMFPGIESASLWVRLPVILLFGMAAAVAEELSYRGVVMGFIQRLSLFGRSATIAAVVSAFLWAMLHLNMTNSPGTKLTQIFILGLAFGWFARRYCIEAAIAAHLGLNIAAVVVGMCVF